MSKHAIRAYRVHSANVKLAAKADELEYVDGGDEQATFDVYNLAFVVCVFTVLFVAFF